jgi:SAM-dependent methyltransferase
MKKTPWYREWFGQTYLDVYPHRNTEEAEQGVSLLLSVLAAEALQGKPALDLACGAGRHLDALRRVGVRAMGLDLSLPLLREGARRQLGPYLVQGDMLQLPFAAEAFGLVTSFFTSFGYFDEEHQDLQVLSGVHHCLARGGWLLLDFLHAERVREELIPFSERALDTGRVLEHRRLIEDGRRVEKEIHVIRGGEETVFLERVRLYDPDELVSLLTAAGFKVVHHFGEYDGSAPTAMSSRTLLLASRP